jgi:superoxide oxidase
MSLAFAVPAPARYTLLARTFHWTIAVLLAGMFITVFLHEGAEKDSASSLFWIRAHMSLGLLVFGLSLLRLLANQTPPEPLTRGIAHLAARGMQKLLMLVTLLLPVTGFLRVTTHGRAVSFFGYQIPSVTGDLPGVSAVFKTLPQRPDAADRPDAGWPAHRGGAVPPLRAQGRHPEANGVVSCPRSSSHFATDAGDQQATEIKGAPQPEIRTLWRISGSRE